MSTSPRASSARARLTIPIALAILAACGRDGTSRAARDQGATGSGPAGTGVSASAMLPPGTDTTEWTIPAKDYASTRYSELSQITTGNVGDLRLAWNFSTGVLRGHEAAPIVANGTMYVVTPHPNFLYALDPVSGEQKWKYDPRTARAARGVACCDVVNRGAAYADGRVFFNTLD